MKNRTVHYGRTSIRTADGAARSIADQRDRAAAFAREHKLRDVTFYGDIAPCTATTRHGLEAMLSDVQSGKVDRLIVDDLSRLSRNPEHVAEMLLMFRSFGVAVQILSDCR